MSALKSSLQSLAASFAEDVVRAIQGASLQELLGEVAGSRARRGPAAPAPAAAPASEPDGPRAARAPVLSRKGRLKRRSADDIAATLGSIVSLLKQNPAGLRAEQIRAQLSMLAKELPRPLAEGLASKALRKKGQKRATVYFAAGSSGPAAEPATPRVTRKK
ncbi:MAG TPA: hypothetical protein VH044_06910 [Polyangiaceae bacterium]|jgi:hypothetical protein|nr:hypothetical protein [Polyangiaceae bacterium]